MSRLKFLTVTFPILLISFIFLLSCGNAKSTAVKLSKVEKSEKTEKTESSEKKISLKNKTYLTTGTAITKDETFSHIKGNVPRLRAMLCGAFTQYQFRDTTVGYQTWEVNDGMDSVMLFQLPVRDYNKVGYWMYTYQVMTSLPDEPLYHAFIHLKELNRDTVIATYYETPDDFDVSLNDLLKDPETAFAKVNLETLELSKDKELVTYWRKNPLFYIGLNILQEEKKSKNEVGYRADLYVVKPKMVKFGTMFYDKEKNKLGSTQNLIELRKLAMMKSDKPK
jgi:hypothetical protein